MDRNALHPDTTEMLSRFRFDEALFDQLVAKLRAGEMGATRNRLSGTVVPPPNDSWLSLPSLTAERRGELESLGRDAIESGQVGVIVLNGGMATRFGGVVKGAVPVFDDRCFLDLKLAQIQRASRGKAQVYLMNSFATDMRTRELVKALPVQMAPEHFTQGIMLRITPEGQLYLDAEGRPSPYAPGHGDLVDSLNAAHIVERFLEKGGKVLLMSNVDNLGAGLSPLVVGAHLSLGGQMTVEVVSKQPGDKGGAPAIVDGRLQIVEDFRFPEEFEQDTIPVFNTNTFAFDAEVLTQSFPLTWFAVKKHIEGVPVIQFERLAGELTAFLESRYILVEREGQGGRFFPVKDPAELETRRPGILELMRHNGVVS